MSSNQAFPGALDLWLGKNLRGLSYTTLLKEKNGGSILRGFIQTLISRQFGQCSIYSSKRGQDEMKDQNATKFNVFRLC